MNIIELELNRYGDGQYTKLWYQKSITVPVGVGNKSDAYLAVVSDSLKLHTSGNVNVYESLDSKEAIENDTAKWKLISDATTSVFPLNAGASYFYIENTSGSLEAWANITGV